MKEELLERFMKDVHALVDPSIDPTMTDANKQIEALTALEGVIRELREGIEAEQRNQ